MIAKKNLSLTPEDVVVVFAAHGEFISRLNEFVDSVDFYQLSPDMQLFMLQNKIKHETTYKKIASYLHDMGFGPLPMKIYNIDTQNNVKPRGDI